MADDDSNSSALPPPPPSGYYANPADARLAYPAQTSAPPQQVSPPPGLPPGAPPPPPGYSATPPSGQPPASSERPPLWSGSVLPLSQDQSGYYFDPLHAGITGRLWGAAKELPGQVAESVALPGRVASGDAPTPYSGGPTSGIDPLLERKTLDTALLFGPSGAAGRTVNAAGKDTGLVAPGARYSEGAPSTVQLKAAADAGYDSVRNSGLDFTGDAIKTLSDGTLDTLTKRAILPEAAPQTYSLLNKLNTVPSGPYGPGFVNVGYLQSIRSELSALSKSGGAEGRAAGFGVHDIDDFLQNVQPNQISQTPTSTFTGDPADIAATLRSAGKNYVAAMKSNDITGALDNAVTGLEDRALLRAQAVNSGANIGNTIKQRVLGFMQNPDNVRGLTDQQRQALLDVVRTNLPQEVTRFTGNMLGGGGGLHGLLGAVGGAAGAGAAGGENALTLLGGAAALPIVGRAALGSYNNMVLNKLNAADTLIRQSSPLAQDWRAGGFVPRINQTGVNNAIWRIVAPGLLNPPQQPATGRPLTEADLAGRA